MPTLHRATELRSALRNYVDMLNRNVCTATLACRVSTYNRYMCMYYHLVLSAQYTTRGINGAWFLGIQTQRLNSKAAHVPFSETCTVFDTLYGYKSVLDKCKGKEYMI